MTRKEFIEKATNEKALLELLNTLGVPPEHIGIFR